MYTFDDRFGELFDTARALNTYIQGQGITRTKGILVGQVMCQYLGMGWRVLADAHVRQPRRGQDEWICDYPGRQHGNTTP
jgi:hypothetical protein